MDDFYCFDVGYDVFVLVGVIDLYLDFICLIYMLLILILYEWVGEFWEGYVIVFWYFVFDFVREG